MEVEACWIDAGKLQQLCHDPALLRSEGGLLEIQELQVLAVGSTARPARRCQLI